MDCKNYTEMKVKLINNYLCRDIPVDTLLETIPGMEVDSKGIFNIPGGMCYLCKTPSGSLKYVLATSVEIVDACSIDWEQRRYELAKEYSKEFVQLQHYQGRNETGVVSSKVCEWSAELANTLIEELKRKKK